MVRFFVCILFDEHFRLLQLNFSTKTEMFLLTLHLHKMYGLSLAVSSSVGVIIDLGLFFPNDLPMCAGCIGPPGKGVPLC